MPISILVHGGAGPLTPEDAGADCAAACLRAARAGHSILARGGSALDAVEAAAVVLEDDPLFNAGTGSCLNEDGEVEMDASLMEGERLGAGAVAVVQGVKNPIRLARRVMERTPHVLLAGPAALRFAREAGVETCDPSALITDRALRRYQAERERRLAPKPGTVGAVALDARGHVAAATSTGGMSGKRAGRVGDSPLIGCGTYADDRTGAVSTTGHGEAIIKTVLAKFACEQLRRGADATAAAAAAVEELAYGGGDGGLILVDRLGRLAFAFNTARMARAWVDADGRDGRGFER